MGKRFFLLLLFFGLLSTAIFWRATFTRVSDYLLRRALQERWGISLTAQKSKYASGAFTFYGVRAERVDKDRSYYCEIDSLEVRPLWGPEGLRCALSLHSPDLLVVQKEQTSCFDLTCPFPQMLQVEMDRGKVTLHDARTQKTLSAEIFSEPHSHWSYQIVSEKSAASCHFTRDERDLVVSLHMQDVDMSEISELGRFFPQGTTFFRHTSGRASGLFQAAIRQGHPIEYFLEATVNGAFLEGNGYHLTADRLFVSCRYPGQDPSTRSVLGEWLFSEWQNTFLSAQVLGGALFLGEEPHLAGIDAKCSFHPDIGPKLFLSAWDRAGHKLEGDLRGYFHSKRANWLDMSLEVEGNRLGCKAFEQDSGSIALHFFCGEIQSAKLTALQELAGFFYAGDRALALLEGTLSADASLLYEQGMYTSLEIGEIAVEDASLHLLAKQGALRAEQCFLQGSYDLHGYSSLSLQLAVAGGEALFAGVAFEELTTTIVIDQGYIVPSRSCFVMADLMHHVEISGPIEEFSLTSLVKGSTGLFFDRYGPGRGAFDFPFSASISLKRKQDEALIFGSTQIGDEEISFGLDLGLKAPHLFAVHHAWMRAKEIDIEKYSAFLPACTLFGITDLSMQYQKKRAHFALQGSGYAIETNGTIFSLKNTHNLSFSYDFAESSWDFDALMQDAHLTIPHMGLTFTQLEGPLSMRRNFLKASHVRCVHEELLLSGDVCLDFRDRAKLDIHCRALEGPFRSLHTLLDKKIGSCLLRLDGAITAVGDGCYFSTDFEEDFTWGCHLALERGEALLGQRARLKNISAELHYTSESLLPAEASCSALLDLQGQEYAICLPYIQRTGEGAYVFDLHVEEEYWDVLRAAGSVRPSLAGGWALEFCPRRTQILGQKVQIEECLFADTFHLEHLQLAASFSVESIAQRMPVVLSFLGMHDFALVEQQNSLGGRLDVAYLFDERGALFDVYGEELYWREYHVPSFSFRAQSQEDGWDAEARFGRYFAEFSHSKESHTPQFSLYQDETRVAQLAISPKGMGKFLMQVKRLEFDVDQLQSLVLPRGEVAGRVYASGYASVELPTKERPWLFDLDLDIEPETLYYQNSWACTNSSLLHLSYSLSQGLLVTGLDFSAVSPSWDRDDLRFQVGALAYRGGEYLLEDVAFYLPQEVAVSLLDPLLPSSFVGWLQEEMSLARDIRISADIRIEEEGERFSCTMAELSLPLADATYRFEEVAFSCTNKEVSWECYAPLADSYCRLQGEMQRQDRGKGQIVFEERELEDLPLRIIWQRDPNGAIYCQSIQGAFCGIDASFHPSEMPGTLSGTLKVDFSKAHHLFADPISTLLSTYDVGRGYELCGQLTLDLQNFDYAFQGICLGKQFEAMGYSFKTLLSQIDCSSRAIHLQELKISDSSGILKIPQLICAYEEDDWHLSIPRIAMNEIRPSLLQEIGKPLGPIQPLVVRDMRIHDFALNFSDPRACKASGELCFINSFKRGHSVFDFPADILGRIFGLDLELLIPVKGDVTFAIQDGKVILTELSNSFSEGERSQFFLAEKRGELPFMDLSGELSIHIKMKQFVLFKFTENFILSITGNLHDPQVGLKRKSSFFSS